MRILRTPSLGSNFIGCHKKNVLVCCMTNISNMFLTQCWKLETSSRSFYDFSKMTIQGDVAVFNS